MLDIKPYQSAFKALSHQVRLELLELIYQESLFCDLNENYPLARNTISGLAELIGLSNSTVSHHVNILRTAEIIRQKRQQGNIYLFINTDIFSKLTEIQAKILSGSEKVEVELGFERQIEHAEFVSASEFVSLHGFKIRGPVSLKSDPESLRCYFQPAKNLSVRIGASYTAVNGKIAFLRNTEPKSLKYLSKITSLYQAFFNKIQE
jgi:DNA-binding transcriptional ArsR family regulator